MFAGPNGSGKSTLKEVLPDELLGVYLNPDELERAITSTGSLDFADYGLDLSANVVLEAFTGSAFLKAQGLSDAMQRLTYTYNCLDFSALGVSVNSYIASVVVDLLRQQLLAARQSFTFETVMSHDSKVTFLAAAQQAGFRTYLYYVATDDPEINRSRVRNRVAQGGHSAT